MADRMSDAIREALAKKVTEDTISSIPNHALIHEMLKRGFAVMKVPEQEKL